MLFFLSSLFVFFLLTVYQYVIIAVGFVLLKMSHSYLEVLIRNLIDFLYLLLKIINNRFHQ